MYLLTGNKAECFGCFACQDVCPVGAIHTKTGKDTYLYPEVETDKCISCGQCEAVCPSAVPAERFRYPTASFAGMIADADDFKKSSSGGAFKAIVYACMEKEKDRYESFYCAGCQYDEELHVVHDVVKITDRDSVDRFCKSKYVQSYPAGVYRKCKEILSTASNFLIFTGSPCQVAALRCFLGREYLNLLCVDLICRGAPSQECFDAYRSELEAQYGSKLQYYEFKTKEPLENGTVYTRSARYGFENGRERRLSRLEDDYLRLFYDEKFFPRPSCSECGFERPERVSDITIGDAWRSNELYPQIVPTQGISAVILSTETGKRLEPFIREHMKVFEMDYDFMVKNNPPLRRTE